MGTSRVLEIALREMERPSLRPLPERAAELLADLDAPPRLVAHLRAVHDVAAQLVDWLGSRDLGLDLDSRSVCFGAATHDIGKVLYPAELSGPGAEHERAGRELLIAHGVEPGTARFAATHASWTPDIGIEDLLVSLADKIWKNKRVSEVEDLVVARLAAVSGRPAWDEFLSLDEILTRIGDGADERLAFQLSYPVTA